MVTVAERYFEKFHGNIHLNIPTSLFTEGGYTANDILVYALISSLSYKSGYCYCSNKTLAVYCHGCSPTTIQKSINKLIKKKMLFKTFQTYNGRLYRILFTSDMAMQENKELILKNLHTELEHNTIEIFDYDWINEEVL